MVGRLGLCGVGGCGGNSEEKQCLFVHYDDFPVPMAFVRCCFEGEFSLLFLLRRFVLGLGNCLLHQQRLGYAVGQGHRDSLPYRCSDFVLGFLSRHLGHACGTVLEEQPPVVWKLDILENVS